jgi:hypothetical protein
MPVKVKPELDPTKTPTAIDIAWAAGIYEGEGHCRHRKSETAVISVTQKDPEILYRLRDWFGGSVRFAQCKTIDPDKQCYNWIACGNRARFFIALVYPFLSARRKTQVDATSAFEFMHGESVEGLTVEDVQQRIQQFERTRYIRGNTPEEIAAHQNNLRRVRRRKPKLTLVA